MQFKKRRNAIQKEEGMQCEHTINFAVCIGHVISPVFVLFVVVVTCDARASIVDWFAQSLPLAERPRDVLLKLLPVVSQQLLPIRWVRRVQVLFDHFPLANLKGFIGNHDNKSEDIFAAAT